VPNAAAGMRIITSAMEKRRGAMAGSVWNRQCQKAL